MKIAYLDCVTGISGDMCLGALVHVGVPLDYLTEQLSHLGIADEFQLAAELVCRNGQQATKVQVQVKPPEDSTNTGTSHADHARHLHEIETAIAKAQLPERVEAWCLAIFRQLAIAEGAVHGIDPEQVHFHEVGATDAIVDIVGTCLGLYWLSIDQLYCSPLPTGGGTVRAAHGRLPVPAPAVLKLWELRQVPVYHNGINRELVTPTGAAIATTLAADFGPPPPMALQKVGLGAGTHDLPLPNILRLWIGTGELPKSSQSFGRHNQSATAPIAIDPASHDHPHPAKVFPREENIPVIPAQAGIQSAIFSAEPVLDSHLHGNDEGLPGVIPVQAGIQTNHLGIDQDNLSPRSPNTLPDITDAEPATAGAHLETICVLETQVDDLSPQAIGYLFEVLLAEGALDVFTQAIGMKKSRPGILLTVLCFPEQVATCEAILFRETTTLGVRRRVQQRAILARESQQIQTNYGPVRMKVAWQQTETGKRLQNVQPEYEDCARIAKQQSLPWYEVQQLALFHWYQQHPPSNRLA